MSIMALAAVTFGINVDAAAPDFLTTGSLTPGAFYSVSVEQMQKLRTYLEAHMGPLPSPRGGGSVANTVDFMVRAGVPYAMMGVGGDDALGQRFVEYAHKMGLNYFSPRFPGAVTGHDIYFREDGTTVFTHGANALLSPETLNLEKLQTAQLFILDGFVLDFGRDSVAAAQCAIKTVLAADIPFVLTLASRSVIQRHRSFYAEFAHRVQWVVGNLEQVLELLELPPGSSLPQVRSALKKTDLQAIVTLDAGGVFARLQEQEYHVVAEQVPVVSSVGAGDNFLGAFLTARWRGATVEHALAVGNRVAAQVIQYNSARLPLAYDVNTCF